MKTILTFGVFDLLHIGHILLFKRAKQLGDRLTVAVQDGDSITKYKPQARIIYSTEERVSMVDAIKYVDDVVIYKDVDKDIQKINFDVLVVGEDQNHDGFKRAIAWCLENGKEVIRLTRTEGISSSIIRNLNAL